MVNKKNKNKKTLLHFEILLVITILLMTTCSVFVSADNIHSHKEIKKTYFFNEPKITILEVNGIFYDQIIMQNSSCASNPGEPKLPIYKVHLLLPQKAKVHEIKITTSKKVFLGTGFDIAPSGESVPISMANLARPAKPNPEIYDSNDPFPGTLFTEVGTYGFRGYNVLVMSLHPVQYIPSTGELFYYNDITVSVELVDDNNTNALYRNLENDKIEITRKVENHQCISTYYQKANQFLSSDYELLIITTDDLKNYFRPLKNIHNLQGIKTKIKTLRDISLFPNRVTPEDIRDFIRGEYLNSGIEYVLIGGDDDIIPAKNLWVQTFSGGYSTTMPSDLYYACLDGGYNYDDDDKWGEPTDGENGEDVDLIADVYVGRACVSNPEEADNFVSKTISYIETGGYPSGKSLMVGEKLMSSPETWGGDYLDEIVNGSSSNMYTTIGIPPTQYTINILYDRNGTWSTSEIIDRINSGVRIINHMGHSSLEFVMKLDKSDVSSLTNGEPCFIYSQGCFAGGFDYSDCIAEHLTVKTNNAAFAVIMNAREGWAEWGGTNGPSQRFHRQFWDAIFGENITEISKANQDSKEDNLYLIDHSYIRWCYYQLNLLGDPTLTFYNIENNPPTKPARPSGVKIGRAGKEYDLKTTSTDKDGDVIYYRWDFGDGTASDWIGPFDSGEEASISHTWSKRGKYYVKVKARDEHRTESEWSYRLVVRMPFYNNILSLNSFLEVFEKYFPR